MKKYFILIIITSLSFSSCRTKVVTNTPTSNVVIVKKAPRNHKIVYVKGKKYYRWNGNYYRKTNRGYVVVRI